MKEGDMTDRLPDGKAMAEEAYDSMAMLTYSCGLSLLFLAGLGVILWRVLR